VIRLFLAIVPDDETRAQLATARAAIEEVVAHSRIPPRITWVAPAAAHVTLRFLGNVVEDLLPAIQKALTAVRVTSFEVRWETIGTFGGRRHPRVIWVAPTVGGEALTALAEQVNGQLDPVAGPGESRPFKPHLTLGRVRETGRRVDWGQAVAAVRWTPTVTRVDRVVLYESRLSPKGPTYTALSTHG
jgi:2'-5' RNA ligase